MDWFLYDRDSLHERTNNNWNKQVDNLVIESPVGSTLAKSFPSFCEKTNLKDQNKVSTRVCYQEFTNQVSFKSF